MRIFLEDLDDIVPPYLRERYARLQTRAENYRHERASLEKKHTTDKRFYRWCAVQYLLLHTEREIQEIEARLQ